MNAIAALSFDLDDTFWAFEAAVQKAETVLYQWLLEFAPATREVLRDPRAIHRYRQSLEVDRPDRAHDLVWLRKESICKILRDAKEDPRHADKGYEVFYAARQNVVLFDDVIPTLKWLSEIYPLAAITNGNADLHAIGIQHFFRATFSAAKFGAAKPDPAIFHAAAQALGVQPSKVLHVGDDLHLDVHGALSAGLQAAWLVRAAPCPPASESILKIASLFDLEGILREKPNLT